MWIGGAFVGQGGLSWLRAGVTGDVERVVRSGGLQPVAADDLDQIGHRPGAVMLVERLPAGGREGIRADRLDADLEGPGLDGLLDFRLDAFFEHCEELVLLGDGQRQQPVQEPRHRRQLVLQRVLWSGVRHICVAGQATNTDLREPSENRAAAPAVGAKYGYEGSRGDANAGRPGAVSGAVRHRVGCLSVAAWCGDISNLSATALGGPR